MAVSIASGVNPPALLVLLADGRLHSGEKLAAALGVSRAAVWKGVERLRALGVEVRALSRRGYQLSNAIELLDAQRIEQELAERARLRNLEILFEVGSTNTRLLDAPAPPAGAGDGCIAELQSDGRGRRGRRWVAPFGSGIAMSLSWTFLDTARALPSLSLVVGIAVVRALVRAGARELTLKWPNDILLHGRKIGGVLIELRGEAGGPAHVVIGVGINVSLPEGPRREIEASGAHVAAVADACAAVPSRNRIAGAIFDELLRMLVEFERTGFAPFRAPWAQLDALNGRAAVVTSGETAVTGTVRGVDGDGALLLETGGQWQRFVSGEVSLRPIGDSI